MRLDKEYKMLCKIYYQKRSTGKRIDLPECSVKNIRGGKMRAMRHALLGFDVHLSVGENYKDSRLCFQNANHIFLMGWSEQMVKKTTILTTGGQMVV